MTLETFIQAMPKVDLHVHLEGSVARETMMMFADQNEVAESLKHFTTWANLLEKPDYDRLDEIVRVTSAWLQVADDLIRAAYDVATRLSKSNVRYAEITVNPSIYPNIDLSLEQFFAALNDGRDRAQRAWGIQLAWILAVPRDEPRKADDYARYVSTVASRRANVVGLGLVGKESVQPVGQFERAFRAVEKKLVPRIPHAGDLHGGEGIIRTIQALAPTRIADAWGAADAPDVLEACRTQGIALDLSVVRAVKLKKVASYGSYPIRALYDDNVLITLGSDMPMLFKTTLSEQYEMLVKENALSVDELTEVALNAVRASYLPEETKVPMLDEFQRAYAELRTSQAV